MARFVRATGYSYPGFVREHLKLGEEPILLNVERQLTAAASVLSFFDTVAVLRASKRLGADKGARMGGVGLRMEGRSGLFDLFWFKADPNSYYAVDTADDHYVCRSSTAATKNT